MGDHSAELSTQERNPWSAVVRTGAAILALIPIINGVAAVIAEALKPYEVYLPSWVFPALNGVIVATALLASLVTRILARPDVNEWLRKYLPLLAPEDKK
jgi:ABC-type Na+ efflux pump permease subunit